jgi:cephalosporin hydroxylase
MADFMGRSMAQEQQDLFIWNKFFEVFPIKTFIEFGTGHGGSTLFFGLKCHDLGIEFHTFDNVQSTDFAMPIERDINLAASFHLIDIFSDEAQRLIGHLITDRPKPLAIFFDNGNKPREWKIYAPLTDVGDFCVVHDWDTEFTAADIGGVAVERILTEESDARGPGWKAMWFVRV